MIENDREAIQLHQLSWQTEPKAQKQLQPSPYEKEVAEIKAKRGDLESIRIELGLSKKKMAELLLVDPSAWTRWTKGISRVPAHVYQSLDWFLQLVDKNPRIQEQLKVDRIQKELADQQRRFQNEMENLKSEMHSENWREERRKLLSQLETAEKLSFVWKALLVLTFMLALAAL